MSILTLTPSTHANSSNARLLDALVTLAPQQYIYRYIHLQELPVFRVELDQAPWPAAVLGWRKAIEEATALIICTPEYLHNMPALLKNALEWLTSSGELFQKPVLPITFTPHPPRGEQAMQSLCWSLQALNAKIVGQLDLYQNELTINENGELVGTESITMLKEAIHLLK